MNRVAIASYTGKTLYAVSVFDDSGLTNLHYTHKTVFNTGYDMYCYVIKLLKQNNLAVGYENMFNCKVYNVVWCDIKNPLNHDQFFFTEHTALGEPLTF